MGETWNGYVELANAIVEKAAEDYLKLKIRKELRGKLNEKDSLRLEECEQFFRSKWYNTLTTIDGEWLIKKLNEEVPVRIEEMKKKSKKKKVKMLKEGVA